MAARSGLYVVYVYNHKKLSFCYCYWYFPEQSGIPTVDDVVLDVSRLEKMPSGDAICLRKGEMYCGATAYYFSARFIDKLTSMISKLKFTTPLDWIIDSTRALLQPVPEGPRRYSMARHIGRISSRFQKGLFLSDFVSMFVSIFFWNGTQARENQTWGGWIS